MRESDYQKVGVLYADDNASARTKFTESFDRRFRVLTAASTQEALRHLKEDRLGVGIVLSPWSVTDPSGKPFLQITKEHDPRILRILLRAASDPPCSLESLQGNHLYHCVPKPWDHASLETLLFRAVDHFLLQSERDRLKEQKSVVLHRLLVMDRVLSLGALATDLSHHLRHVMPAMQSFMDVASPNLEASCEHLTELLQKDRWKERAESSRRQTLALDHVLGDVGHTAKPFLPTFNDQVQPHACLAKATEHLKTRLAEKGLQVVNNIPKNLPTLKSDEGMMDHLMLSIFEEALSVLPSGTTLQMDGVKESDQVIRLQIACGEPGLQPERLRWIFDPFLPLAPGEVKPGLHLLAAFLVAYHHGGVVHSTLQAGLGRVLRFHLPIDPDKLVVTDGERNILHKLLFTETMWEEFLR